MEIRKTKEEDIEKIWEIEKESREHHEKVSQVEYQRLNKAKTDEKARHEFETNLKKNILGEKVVSFVVEIDDEVIGWIFSKLGTWGWSDDPPKMVWIEDIGVLKKYQRKGIAKKLIGKVEEVAKKEGAKYSYLTVWLKNKPAYELYKKNNYEDFAIEMVKKF